MVCLPLVATILSSMAIYHASNWSPVVTGHGDVEDGPGHHRRGEPHRGELRSARHAVHLGEHQTACADLAVKMSPQRRLAFSTEPPGAVLDHVVGDLRHPGRRCAGPRRERKNVKLRQPARIDQIERAFKHRLGLGRDTRDDVAAERDVGAEPQHLRAERNGVGARVAALHPLEDHVVASLQRQMQMRHQPLVGGERVEQVGVGLDGIDRGQSQPLELRHLAKKSFHQQAEARRVAGDVDAGQHDLAMAALDQEARLRDHIGNRHRSRIAAAERDDAEGAAVVAAILDLQERAGVAGDILEPMKRGLAGRHDVADRDFFRRRPMRGGQLLFVAEHAIDLGHRGEHAGIGLCGAAGHHDLRIGSFAASFSGSLGAPASPPRRSPRRC